MLPLLEVQIEQDSIDVIDTLIFVNHILTIILMIYNFYLLDYMIKQMVEVQITIFFYDERNISLQTEYENKIADIAKAKYANIPNLYP